MIKRHTISKHKLVIITVIASLCFAVFVLTIHPAHVGNEARDCPLCVLGSQFYADSLPATCEIILHMDYAGNRCLIQTEPVSLLIRPSLLIRGPPPAST